MPNEVHLTLDRPSSRQQWERESPSAPLAETSPTRSPQWKQWRATIRPHTFANNVLCTVGLQNGYWTRGLRRYSTQHWRISRRQPARVFREKEDSDLLFTVCSQLQFQLGCKEADISARFSSRSSPVVRCRLFHLLCADSYKLVEGEYMSYYEQEFPVQMKYVS